MGLPGSLLGQLGDPCMMENHWKDSQPVKASPSTETFWDSESPLIWWKLQSLSPGGKVALNFRSLSINICSKYSKTHSKMKPRNWDTSLHQVKVLYQMCSGIIHRLHSEPHLYLLWGHCWAHIPCKWGSVEGISLRGLNTISILLLRNCFCLVYYVFVFLHLVNNVTQWLLTLATL